MKRIILIVLITLFLVSLNAYSDLGLGIGAAFNLELLRGSQVFPGASISFSPPVIPIVIGVGATFGSTAVNLGLTVDWWLFRAQLIGILHMYVGPGLYFLISEPLELGVRIPVGFQLFVIPPLEIFLELAPLFGIGFGDPVVFPQITLVGAIGFRFWF